MYQPPLSTKAGRGFSARLSPVVRVSGLPHSQDATQPLASDSAARGELAVARPDKRLAVMSIYKGGRLLGALAHSN
mgnify:CR=1 FL=1